MKFSFRKSDRDAIILLILIILVTVVLFPLLRDKEDSRQYFVRGGQSGSKQKNITRFESSLPSEMDGERLFPFDPNTADSIQLLRLGLRPWQVRNIYKYRAKGGRYRQKEDFAMLYGLTLEDYRRLEPYIEIAPEVMARDVIARKQNKNVNSDVNVYQNGSDSKTPESAQQNSTKQKISYGETIDINTADTTQLKRIPGIGSYFARRIVELRQRRQAFVSPDELLSIRNFPETALDYMTASQNFSKVHINSFTLQQLKAHPLINYTQASDILR